MSFILDALRKSEHERQRQAGPGIADIPVARAAPRVPVALIAVAALLAVNLGVLLYFMLRDETPEVLREAPVTVAPVAPAASQPQPAPVAAIVPPAPAIAAPEHREVRPLTREAAPELPEEDAPAQPDPSLLPPAPGLVPPAPSLPRPTLAGSRAGGESVPRLDTLPAQATAGLPALNLDLHIYATDPGQRAAFINGRRYREGDTMPEGVEVSSITPDGAVLSYRGQRFLLPRQ